MRKARRRSRLVAHDGDSCTPDATGLWSPSYDLSLSAACADTKALHSRSLRPLPRRLSSSVCLHLPVPDYVGPESHMTFCSLIPQL